MKDLKKEVTVSNIQTKAGNKFRCACNPTYKRLLTVYASIWLDVIENPEENLIELFWKIYMWDNEYTTAEDMKVSDTLISTQIIENTIIEY